MGMPGTLWHPQRPGLPPLSSPCVRREGSFGRLRSHVAPTQPMLAVPLGITVCAGACLWGRRAAAQTSSGPAAETSGGLSLTLGSWQSNLNPFASDAFLSCLEVTGLSSRVLCVPGSGARCQAIPAEGFNSEPAGVEALALATMSPERFFANLEVLLMGLLVCSLCCGEGPQGGCSWKVVSWAAVFWGCPFS